MTKANLWTIVLGLVFVVIGVWLWILWRDDFLVVLKGCLGVTLFFAGILAVLIGWSEWKASKEFESAVPSTTAPAPSPSQPESSPAETESAPETPAPSEPAQPES